MVCLCPFENAAINITFEGAFEAVIGRCGAEEGRGAYNGTCSEIIWGIMNLTQLFGTLLLSAQLTQAFQAKL